MTHPGAYRCILFDLDGTLTDSKIGITGSARYALERLGIRAGDLDDLEHFIGPPLKETFAERYGFSPEKTLLAMRYYREYYAERGIHENTLYPGVIELLDGLRERGKALALATTKVALFARQILESHCIADRFQVIAGAALDGSIWRKEEIVRLALAELGRPDPAEAVMIGDSSYDLTGAQRNGIDFIGVRYGYGFRRGEDGPGCGGGRAGPAIEAARRPAVRLVDSVAELRGLLLG